MKKIKLHILLLIVISFLLHGWIISKNNFFIFDDYGHFNLIINSGHNIYNSLLPKQMYNDRPAGELILNFFLFLFKDNYQLHHLCLLLIHMLNTILVYLLAEKIFKNKNRALLSAIIFNAWPKSIYGIKWDSAIFDLASCTWILLTLLLATQKNKLLNFFSIFTYLLSIKTKEVALLTPLLITSYFILINSNKKLFTNTIPHIFIMIVWILKLLQLAFISNFMGFNNGSTPYSTTFNPLILLQNLFKYFHLYFDLFSANQTFSNYKIYVVIFIVLFIIYSIYKGFKNNKLILPILGIIFYLGPVLPLVNMQHKLYLYIPSIFIGMLIANIIPNFSVFPIILVLLLLNLFEKNYRIEKKWWLETGNKNLESYEILKEKISIDKNIEKIYIQNLTYNISIFQFGPGDILRYMYKKNFKVITSENSLEDKVKLDNNALLIDYNNGKINIIQ